MRDHAAKETLIRSQHQIAASDLIWIFIHSVVDILLKYIKKGDVK